MGEGSTLTAPPRLNYSIASWLPDGKQILVVVSAAGHTPITYLQDVSSGTARQITREGRYAVFAHDVAVNVSPDGRYFLTTDGGSHYRIQPIGDGEPTEIKGLTAGDFPIEWHNNSQNIFLERRAGLKKIAIRSLPDGGTFEEAVPVDRQEMLCLSDEDLGKLDALATRCEDVYGMGRDIEWAIADGELYLLQCRAITRAGA